MNKELERKIFAYLEKLERGQIKAQISSKKKDLLLASQKEYQKIEQIEKEYQALFSELNKEEQSSLSTEIKDLVEQREQIITKIKQQIIEEENISQNVIMEIRPGPGGDEAGLFVNDLYCMYVNFAKKKSWKIEMVESKVGYKGSFSFVSFLIKGERVFDYLKNEAGVHCVKRIPETGKGEKHTSTATVVILPEPQDIVLKIPDSDLRYEPHRSSGAGGQHVNTTDSAVRVVHIPTGIIAVSQDGRSQHDNKKKALEVLKSRLWEKLQLEKEKEIGGLRSFMIGTAERSENFRTYNFQSNRINDKRLKIKLENKLDRVMEGDLEEICQKSIDYQVERRITET